MSAQSMRAVLLLYGVVAFISSLIRAAGWAAIFVAIFGWRDDAFAVERRLQFSIRNLLVLTLAVALLSGLIRMLVDLFGEQALYLATLLIELPIFICWVYGGWLAWTRRSRHPEVSKNTLIAIAARVGSLVLGVATIVCLFAGASPQWLGLYRLVEFIAGPTSWILLLVAAFGWRAPLMPPSTANAGSSSH